MVEFFTGDGITIPLKELPQHGKIKGLVDLAIGKNTQSMFDAAGEVIGGNATDQALMKFLGADTFKKLESSCTVTLAQSFNSANKFSQAYLGDLKKTFYKGAPERLLSASTKYLSLSGEERTISWIRSTPRLMSWQISPCVSWLSDIPTRRWWKIRFVRIPLSSDLWESGMMFVRRHGRPLRLVQHAGIQVVMITGDRLETAVAIAKDAGLLKTEDDIALTSRPAQRAVG